MNLTAILADLYRRLALPAAPNPTETVRLTSFVNTTHRQILGLPGLESLRDDTIRVTTTAGRHTYGLPAAVTRIEGITDVTGQIKLGLQPLQEIRASDPGLTASGKPDTYAVRGYQQVHTQPTGPATTLAVKSSSAADTTVAAFIEAVKPQGHQLQAGFTLNGTTPVTIATDWVEITKFYLTIPAVGEVGLYQDAAATQELATIMPPQTFARYLAVQLYPTPSSATTYYVDYVRKVVDISQGTDEPFLPEDFHWLLVEGALLKEWTKRDDDRRVSAEREYAKGISALKYFVTCQADDLPVSGRGRWHEQPSRYGAYYPATRY